MSGLSLALLGIAFMVLLMMLKMPVGFAMFFAGFLGFTIMSGFQSAASILSSDIWTKFSNYGFSVIPMFVFMGQIVYRAGVTETLFNTAYKWVGHWKGGMAMTTVAASTAFAAICGSNAATTATMGTIALPEMKKYGYSDTLATGTVAVGGSLGVVIPPSVVLVVIAIQTEMPLGVLFVASVIPGLLLSSLFMITIYVYSRKNPQLAPVGEKATLKEKLKALPGVLDILALFLLVIGSLYAGWVSPTEAGAVGSFGAIVITLLRRKMNWKVLTLAITDTLKTTAMVMVLVTGAVVFGRFLAVTRLPYVLVEVIDGMDVPRVAILAVVILIYIFGGMVMDSLGFLTLSIPIFFPLLMKLNYDPVWFVVMFCIITTMGAVTPPVGLNAFIVKGLVPEVPLERIFKGIGIFIAAYLIDLILMIAFPQIITGLPMLLS